MSERPIVFSYGGGIQSVALRVLVREGILPRPDYTVFADTGREKRTTLSYLHEVAQPYLDPIGVKVEIASHALAKVDMYSHQGKLVIPAYDAHEGRLATYCSGEWKREVVARWWRGGCEVVVSSSAICGSVSALTRQGE